MADKVPRPRIIAFEVTRRCRYDCRHCRAGAGCVGDEAELTAEQCKKVLSAVARFSKTCMIILTGGEPMEREDIYKIIRHGRKRALRIVLASCGYLIDDESIGKLKQAGVSALSFSLDGASAETNDTFRQSRGAFDAVIKAAQTARRAGIRFQINTTISKINVDEVVAIADLARKLGAYCFNPFILVPTGRGQDLAEQVLDPVEYEVFLNELLAIKLKSGIEVRVTCAPQFARVCRQEKVERISGSVGGCIGGREFGFISYRGDVQACGFLNISAGNVVENGYNFGKIWRESELLKEIRNLSAYKGSCGICEYVATCGGCRARAYTMSGDYLAGDPVCNYQPRGKD